IIFPRRSIVIVNAKTELPVAALAGNRCVTLQAQVPSASGRGVILTDNIARDIFQGCGGTDPAGNAEIVRPPHIGGSEGYFQPGTFSVKDSIGRERTVSGRMV